MPLDEYKRKRNFGKTPEPSGRGAKRASADEAPSGSDRVDADRLVEDSERSAAPGRRSFVIQKHAASRLHYDFRLELDGVLVSWAVPKGPSLDPHDKRLAVHVEDHPLDYASFEGVIPAGEYGAGTVIVWDRGWWEPIALSGMEPPDPAVSLAKGELKVRLHGKKLEGGWVLVRLRPRENERAENWLLIKERDEHVRSSSEFDVVAARPESVASGRVLEQVAAEESGPFGSTHHSNRPKTGGEALAAAPAPPVPPALGAPSLPRGSDPLPADAPIELATLVDQAPDGEGWIHEVKYDGYRIRAIVEDGRARLLTRSNLDWTQTFAPIARAVERLPVSSAMLDGEVVAFDSEGITDFGTLQDAIATSHPERLAYVVFDLLYLEGHDLRQAPLVERKDLLRTLLATQPANGVVRYADHVAAKGLEFHRQTCTLALEGSVSKRADRPWVGGRTSDWLKVKCTKRQEFVIGGFTDPGGSRTGFGALLLGVHGSDGALRYAGRVGTGFGARLLEELRPRLDGLEIAEPPFADPPRLTGQAHWVRPELVAEVAFAEWTREGLIRQPSFKGLREDKLPTEVTYEVAPTDGVPDTGATSAARGGTRPARRGGKRGAFGKDVVVAGVKVTNPEKPLFARSPLTKLELVRYYEQVAPFMLPHIANRPLTLVRCPVGRGEGCFYQKHPDVGTPEALKTMVVEERGGPALYLYLDEVAGLLSLAQMGALEIHTWGSRVDKPYLPDRLVFDLDPGPGVGWRRVIDTAFVVRDRLAALGFTPFVKTTGGKGLHVVIPVEPSLTFAEARAWTKSIVDALVAEDPSSLTGKMAKKVRSGRVFVDYVRNSQGATAVAPYSTRARPGAPIAVPVEWEELREGLDPKQFTTERVLERLARFEGSGSDPWAGMQKAQASARTLRAAASASS